MNFINLALVFSAMLGLASATCYSGGQSWGGSSGKQAASAALSGVCNTLAHSYGTGQSQSVCINGPAGSGTRFDFNVFHVSNGDRTLSHSECIDGLNKEITGCDYGGRSRYTNWQYTSDPNTGGC